MRRVKWCAGRLESSLKFRARVLRRDDKIRGGEEIALNCAGNPHDGVNRLRGLVCFTPMP